MLSPASHPHAVSRVNSCSMALIRGDYTEEQKPDKEKQLGLQLSGGLTLHGLPKPRVIIMVCSTDSNPVSRLYLQADCFYRHRPLRAFQTKPPNSVLYRCCNPQVWGWEEGVWEGDGQWGSRLSWVVRIRKDKFLPTPDSGCSSIPKERLG